MLGLCILCSLKSSIVAAGRQNWANFDANLTLEWSCISKPDYCFSDLNQPFSGFVRRDSMLEHWRFYTDPWFKKAQSSLIFEVKLMPILANLFGKTLVLLLKVEP